MSTEQPQVYWTWTPSHLTLLPDDLPKVVPSPIGDGDVSTPFTIDKDLYNFVLRPEIPIVFASVYVLTVFALNAYNRRHNYKPWAVSKSKAFNYFVIVHNVVLSLYSFATWLAMGRAFLHSIPDWDADNWSVKMADGLCKLHGPRGLGDAATYNTSINIWEIKNTAFHLTRAGVPDPTDVGRLWNSGLAFWGWIFYMSKFYEVLDTLILLAKGKRSGTLQTYHHAGAMLCMWAGIRYMSPPIWMFVFVNSGIHALMYTYFALSALGYKVPHTLKRTLTMLQIGQFLWGASYAAAHLFIQYDIPITTSYQITHAVEHAARSVTSVAQAATSAVSEAIESPTSSVMFGAWVKKMLLRAAGEDGVAERLGSGERSLLGNLQQQVPIVGDVANAAEKVHSWIEHRYETKYRTDLTRINCIDTTGEAFAIYLNLLYLSPLTWLFLRFFSRAYTQRGRPKSASQAVDEITQSARDAQKETKRSVESAGKKAERELDERTSQAPAEVRKDVEKVRESWREGTPSPKGKNKKKAAKAASKAASEAQSYAEAVKENITSKDSVKSHTEALKESIENNLTTVTQESSTTTTSQSQSAENGGGLFRRSWTEDTELSEEKQDANLEASQNVRPDPEDDTDAMGRSGAIVNRADA